MLILMVNTAVEQIKRKPLEHRPIHVMEVQSPMLVAVVKMMTTQNAHSGHAQVPWQKLKP